MTDLTTRRLSLRLRLSGKCSSKLEMPTIMRSGGLEDPRHLFPDIGLDEVAGFDVLETIEADAAVEPGAHLGDVVLEAPQRSDLAFVDDAVVAQQAHRGAARDHPFDHVAAGDGAHLRHLEGIADLGPSGGDLAEGGVEQAG